MVAEPIKVLDYGYVRFIEAWGHGDAGKDAISDYRADLDMVVHSDDMECGIIEAARQSTQGNFRGWEQDSKLLAYLFNGKPQHATPFEFSGMIIEVQAPIFVFREWHRHRTQSYNEMSARYAPLPNLNYLPTTERCFLTSKKNKQAGTIKDAAELTDGNCLAWLKDLELLYEQIEDMYQQGLELGIPKEIARICLPVGRYSRMRASTNLRNWLAFVTLRSDPQAQWEIQQFSNAVGTLIAKYFPRTWGLFKLAREPQTLPQNPQG